AGARSVKTGHVILFHQCPSCAVRHYQSQNPIVSSCWRRHTGVADVGYAVATDSLKTARGYSDTGGHGVVRRIRRARIGQVGDSVVDQTMRTGTKQGNASIRLIAEWGCTAGEVVNGVVA